MILARGQQVTRGRIAAAVVVGGGLLGLFTCCGCGETPAGGASNSTADLKADAARSNQADTQPTSLTLAPVAGGSHRPRDTNFDTIKFAMEKTERFRRVMLTPQIEALVGKSIRIRGYILPSFKQHGLEQFVLVRDNMQCCFGPGAALYDCVLVEMEPGKSTDFTVRPVAVEGVFDVREVLDDDGKHLAIYHLQGTAVK